VPFASSVLVPTDLSPASHAAIAEAARLARAEACKITLLYVLDTEKWVPPPSVTNAESMLRRMVEEANGAAHSVLAALREHFFAGLSQVEVRTLEHASAALAICQCAREWGADLIVIASHGRAGAVPPGGVGSVTEKVVRAAECRVLVVPSARPSEIAH
jgi:nucleotide-binding universal stress UspA family protein